MNSRLSFVALCLAGVAAQAQAPSQGSGDPGRSSKSGVRERAPFNDSIRQQDMKAGLFFLAADPMQGRLTDTVGNRLAAEWVESRFERMGLTPAMPDGSYFEPYDLMTATLGRRENSFAFTGGAGARRELAHGTAFYAHRFSPTSSAAGPVVFAGFGITSPERSHDDLEGNAVKGAIVLVLDHEPGENDSNSPFDGVVRAEASSALRKALFAQARGAAGLLIVSDVHNHPEAEDFVRAARGYWPEQPRRIEAYTLAAWMEQVRIPVAQISVEAASALVRGTGRTLPDLSKSAEIVHGVTPRALPGARAELATSVDRHIVPDRNVVAIAEGTDPKLKDEFVIVCGHYDHDGTDGARVFNLMRRSDHWPFLQRGVPALWFHTGLHPDYHTVNDRPERINYEKMEKIARMIHQMSWDLANADGRPRLDRAKTTTSASR